MKKLRNSIITFMVLNLSLSLLVSLEPNGDREPPVAMDKVENVFRIY